MHRNLPQCGRTPARCAFGAPTPAGSTANPGGGGREWSKKRLSFGRERGLGGHVVQKASESHRIHPNPAKTIKPRRISDHPRAKPAENSETQTHFGPPDHQTTRRLDHEQRTTTAHGSQPYRAGDGSGGYDHHAQHPYPPFPRTQREQCTGQTTGPPQYTPTRPINDPEPPSRNSGRERRRHPPCQWPGALPGPPDSAARSASKRSTQRSSSGLDSHFLVPKEATETRATAEAKRMSPLGSLIGAPTLL